MQNKIGYVLFILCVSLCASLLIIPIVRAEDHYADIQVTLQKDGTAQVTGISTESRFSTGVHDDYTSKKGSFWLLNLTSTTNLSDYFISLTFPENTEINYLKVSGRSRISAEDKLMIVTTGTDEPMNIVVQYRINSNTSSLLFLWVAIVIVVLIILGFFFWRYKKSRKNNEHNEHRKKVDEKENNEVRNKSGKKESEKESKKESETRKESEKLIVLRKILSENQLKILNLLLDANGELTQKQLQHRSGFAKATLSRNIELLSKKNIIVKQSRGMTNMIILNKELVE